MKVKSESEVAQSCLTPSDPMDCSLPGSSVHGIFQATVLERGAIAFSDNEGDLSSIPGLGRSPGEGIGCPVFLDSPCGSAGKESTCKVEDLASIPGLGRSPGEENSTYSSTVAWKIPWTEEPGRLQSRGSRKVGHNFSLFTFTYWRRKWQPIPVFLPGESQGWGSLVGCRLWSHTESDTTEAT